MNDLKKQANMKKTLSILALTIFTLPLFFTIAHASEFRLHTIFSDHMILQQNTNNAIWGTATPASDITVEASWGEKAKVKTNAQGKWQVLLKTPGHGTGYTINISGPKTIELNDVAIGEVWLCAGQSNMGWAMGQSFGAEEEAKVANFPNLRIYKSAREHWHEPLPFARDRLATWKTCTPESAAATSAVSYYFGKTLHQHLDIPVGIIVQAFAGTPIEGWMPWDIQNKDPRALEHKRLLDEGAERLRTRSDVTPQKSLDAYAKELAAYNTQIDKGETMKNNVKALSPPIITRPPSLGHQYPHIFLMP